MLLLGQCCINLFVRKISKLGKGTKNVACYKKNQKNYLLKKFKNILDNKKRKVLFLQYLHYPG